MSVGDVEPLEVLVGAAYLNESPGGPGEGLIRSRPCGEVGHDQARFTWPRSRYLKVFSLENMEVGVGSLPGSWHNSHGSTQAFTILSVSSYYMLQRFLILRLW